jgi:hypothetical protein
MIFTAMLIAVIPSVYAASCGMSDDNQLIMRISPSTNAHGELWNGGGDYPIQICYNSIFGKNYTGTNPHNCNGTNNVVLKLSDTTNAHAEVKTQSDYSYSVCYGDLNCTVAGSTPSGYTFVVALSSNTNSHLSINSADTNYATRIYCKSPSAGCVPDCSVLGQLICSGGLLQNCTSLGGCLKLVTVQNCTSTGLQCSNGQCVSPLAPPNITSANWTNMKCDGISSVNVNDSLNLKVYGTNLAGVSIEYKIWKCTVPPSLGCIANPIPYYTTTIQSTELVWKPTQSGNYHFNARLLTDSTDGTVSNNLEVLGTSSNSPIVAVMVKPTQADIYNKNFDISFEQASYDLDDDISVKWDFGDGNITILSNCSAGRCTAGNNCNITHYYTSTGQKTIRLTATNNRGQSDSIRRDILIIDPSLSDKYAFAWISYPPFGENIEGVRVQFDARNSFAFDNSSGSMTCLTNNCPSTTANGYNIATGGNFQNLAFNWTFDGNPITHNYDNGTNGSFFNKTYSTAGDHWANLTISINPSSSTRTEFWSYLEGECSLFCEGSNCNNLVWFDEEGNIFHPFYETGYCVGVDGEFKTNDDCCPGGMWCNNENVEEGACEIIPEGYECSNKVTCSDYNKTESCEEDICGKGKYSPPSLQICGKTIFENGSYYVVPEDSCRCVWESGKCKLKYDVNCSIGDCGSDCLKSFVRGECSGGLMKIDWSVNTIGAGCTAGSALYSCGAIVKLPFFSILNLILSFILITLIYAFFIIFRKHKRDLKNK